MKILIINWRDITHPWSGGAERHIHELAKGWHIVGHNITILCGSYKGALKKENIDGIRILRIGGTYSIFFLAPFYFLFKLREEKFKFIIDVAHGLPFFTPFFATGAKIAIIVHHNHEKLWKTEFNHFFSYIGIFLEKKIVPLIYRNISSITLANTTKKELEQIGFRRVFAVPPGINTKIYKINSIKSPVPLILYLGRLRKYKNVDMLLNLYSSIKKEIPRVKLVIIGTGQDKDRLEDIARRKKILNDVIFKGYVSEEEKIQFLQKAWVLAFPSFIEGWGLVALEAAACGTPTVGFDVPGISDAIKHGQSGILVNNKLEFKLALINIIKNKNLRENFSKNAVKFAKRFNWNKSAMKFLSILELEN